MSEKEALKIFTRQPVSQEMIEVLAATTNSIIQVKNPVSKFVKASCNSDLMVSSVSNKSVSLVTFIKKLIQYSNVQTPTLMATLTYLNRLRNILPANAVGMETTRHRIFIAALILSAKSLNDSSPMNKHWTKYTDGLLNIEEVNMAERELIALLKWNLIIKQDELILALQPFLTPIKHSLNERLYEESYKKYNYYRLSNSYSNKSISSRSTSSSSISSYDSSLSLKSSSSTNSFASSAGGSDEYKYREPLASKSSNFLNIPSLLKHPKRRLTGKHRNLSDLMNADKIMA